LCAVSTRVQVKIRVTLHWMACNICSHWLAPRVCSFVLANDRCRPIVPGVLLSNIQRSYQQHPCSKQFNPNLHIAECRNDIVVTKQQMERSYRRWPSRQLEHLSQKVVSPATSFASKCYWPIQTRHSRPTECNNTNKEVSHKGCCAVAKGWRLFSAVSLQLSVTSRCSASSTPASTACIQLHDVISTTLPVWRHSAMRLHPPTVSMHWRNVALWCIIRQHIGAT